jgi:Tle cognate immunity protein 4 C-terminal domain/Tle cognate immunity protein 4 N-terminal domain
MNGVDEAVRRPAARRNLVLGLAGVVALAALAYGFHRYSIQNPNRGHAMTALTQSMQTVCFGRFLLDTPAKAEFAIGSTEIDLAKIVFEEPPSSNDFVFVEKVRRREGELRAMKHETRGSSLLEAIDVNGGRQRLFVYFPDETTVRLFNAELYVRDQRQEWKILKETINEYLTQSQGLLALLASRLKAREMAAIPTEPGLCIRNGIVFGPPSSSKDYGEDLTGGIRLDEYGLSISLTCETSGPRERGQTLLDRVDKSYRMLGAEAAGIKTLRRSENVVIDGRKGQEIVTTFAQKGFDVIDAKAEVYGNATPKAPTFKVQMEAGRAQNPAPGESKNLSNEEALALWDAILKSIRPRPGAF